MSFTEEKRDIIKSYILEKIFRQQKDFVKRTAEAFQISLNTVYRYIRELENEKLIEKEEQKTYRLVEKYEMISLKRSLNELKEEDTVYDKYIAKFIKELPDNVQRIWQYSFMEMMNNAIDHSAAENVQILVIQNVLTTTILIIDDGVGIFKKIKEHFQFESLDVAVSELFKGKLTTDSNNHSGEGIFFTSRVLDVFAAISDGKIFAHDKFRENLLDLNEVEYPNYKTGTTMLMQLSNSSKKILKEVFNMFSDENGGFSKTQIPIKNIFETYPVSRSQAKRLCNRFENFEEIELDFKGIDEIGQGFAHEIFVVFQNKNQNVRLIPVNMSKDVEKMIHHVRNN